LYQAQRSFVPLCLVQQFVPFRTCGKLPRLLAQGADLIAQAIRKGSLVHSRSRVAGYYRYDQARKQFQSMGRNFGVTRCDHASREAQSTGDAGTDAGLLPPSPI
jgi:hypothetical protein